MSVVDVFVLCLLRRADAMSAFINLISSSRWFNSRETIKFAILLDEGGFEWVETGGASTLGSLGGGVKERGDL